MSNEDILVPFIESRIRRDVLRDLSAQTSWELTTKVNDLITANMMDDPGGPKKDGKEGVKDGKDDGPKKDGGDTGKEGKEGSEGKESCDPGVAPTVVYGNPDSIDFRRLNLIINKKAELLSSLLSSRRPIM